MQLSKWLDSSNAGASFFFLGILAVPAGILLAVFGPIIGCILLIYGLCGLLKKLEVKK